MVQAEEAAAAGDRRALAKERDSWIANARAFLRKRRLPGSSTTSGDAKRRKTFRLKSARWVVAVDNALRVSTGSGLTHFCQESEQARRGSPFDWPRLTVTADMGPDGLCALAFLKQQRLMCCWEVPDFSHGVWRDFQLALRHTGHWSFFLILITTMNIVHGPFEEQMNFADIKESIRSYMVSADPESCPVFSSYLRQILKDWKMSERIHEADIARTVFELLPERPVFRRRGEKVSLNRFFHAVRKLEEEELPDWHVKVVALLYWGITAGKFKDSKMAATFGQHLLPPAGDVEAKGTTKEGEKTTRNLWQVCENGLHVSVVVYCNEENHQRACIIARVSREVRFWHHNQNQRLRDVNENLKFLQEQSSGDFFDHLFRTLDMLFDIGAMADMLFDLTPAEVVDLDHPAVELQQELAAFAVDFAFSLCGNRVRRTLWLLRGWPGRGCMFACGPGDNEVREAKDQLLADRRRWLSLQEHDSTRLSPMLKRSVFLEIGVEQLSGILEKTGGEVTPQVREWARGAYTGVASAQIVEDGFNRMKLPVKQGRNRRVARERRHGMLLSAELENTVRKYTPLDYESSVVPKGQCLPEDAYKSRKAQCSIDMDGLAGPSAQTSWYSPGASGWPQRFADLAILETLEARFGDLHRCDSTWRSCLLDGGTALVRRRGENTWFFTMGTLPSGLAGIGWPAEEVEVFALVSRSAAASSSASSSTPALAATMCFRPRRDVRIVHLLVATDLEEFEARSLLVQSPLAQKCNTGTPRASCPLPLTIQAGEPKPLLQHAAEHAFHKIPKASLLLIAEELQAGVTSDASLFDVLFALVKQVLECDDMRALAILKRRLRAPSEGVTDILGGDGLDEVVEKADRSQFKKQVKDEEQQKAAAERFRKDLQVGLTKAAKTKEGKKYAQAEKTRLKKVPRQQFVPSKLGREYLVALAPPGAKFWRSEGGTWQVHLRPHARLSRSWQKYGEAEAARLILRGCWEQHLSAAGLDDSHCPVQGLFD